MAGDLGLFAADSSLFPETRLGGGRGILREMEEADVSVGIYELACLSEGGAEGDSQLLLQPPSPEGGPEVNQRWGPPEGEGATEPPPTRGHPSQRPASISGKPMATSKLYCVLSICMAV